MPAQVARTIEPRSRLLNGGVGRKWLGLLGIVVSLGAARVGAEVGAALGLAAGHKVKALAETILQRTPKTSTLSAEAVGLLYDSAADKSQQRAAEPQATGG